LGFTLRSAAWWILCPCLLLVALGVTSVRVWVVPMLGGAAVWPIVEMEVVEGRSNLGGGASGVPSWVSSSLEVAGWCAKVLLVDVEWA
jgi:hypothetical protein